MIEPRVIVLAARRTIAVDWCRQNGVLPHGRATIIATQGPSLRGYSPRRDDRVVDLGGAAPEVYQDLQIAQLSTPTT